jgi:hypothetical protein
MRDTVTILCSFLRLNTAKLLTLPTLADRMRAILYTVQDIPQSLLFHSGSRDRPSSVHRNRWLPTMVSRFQLESPYMKMDGQGLEMSNSGTLLRLDMAGYREDESHSFCIITDSDRRYKVRTIRESDDEMCDFPLEECILLLDSNRDSPRRGALLRIEKSERIERENQSEKSLLDEDDSDDEIKWEFTALYDCPVELQRDSSKKRSSKPFDATKVRSWKLRIPQGRWNIELQARSLLLLQFLFIHHTDIQ